MSKNERMEQNNKRKKGRKILTWLELPDLEILDGIVMLVGF